MGVMEPVKLTITNWDKDKEWIKIENNPEDPEDKREVEFTGNLWIESEDFRLNPDKKYNRLKLGGEVRLKGAYAVTATDYITNDNGINTENILKKLYARVDFSNFYWGEKEPHLNFKENILKEILVDNIYESILQVEEGDVVLDIGASISLVLKILRWIL